MKEVLIVEDEPYIREILEEFFRIMGLSTVVAQDGEEGWQKFQKEGPFDLYLLDVRVPKMNGFELAKHIRSQDGENPIIFLTGLIDEDTLRRATNIPKALYLKKPITFAVLKETVKEVGLL